jgi:hypothetical protein
VIPHEEQASQQPGEDAPEQLQLQAVVMPSASDSALPVFRVVGDFRTAERDAKAVVTTAVIEGRTRIDRRQAGAAAGDSLGWIQTLFRVRLQADYYAADGDYVESHLRESNRPLIDPGENDDVWYNPPAQFGGDPVIGAVFEDSPQFAALLQSPRGGLLTRFSASWEFGCWLATRTPAGRVKFLYHQDWTASFHAERRNGATELSGSHLSLGDSGPGPGSLMPLMEGASGSTFLDSPGIWGDLGSERLDKDGIDLT